MRVELANDDFLRGSLNGLGNPFGQQGSQNRGHTSPFCNPFGQQASQNRGGKSPFCNPSGQGGTEPGVHIAVL